MQPINFQYIQYCVGFVLAIGLCYRLGPIFYIPMILDLAFDLALQFGFLSGWDIRLLMVSYGFAVFVWVIMLSKGFRKLSPILIMAIDLAFVYQAVLPKLEMAGVGQPFWNATSTAIFTIWNISIFLLASSTVFMGSLWQKLRGGFVDALSNPRKRFLIPIALWTGFNVFHETFAGSIPPWMHHYGYKISSNMLVWGWVVLEMPFFLMERRFQKKAALNK